MNRLWMGALIIGSWMVYGLAYSQDPLEIASQPDIEQGRDIYRIHCQECHGTEGHGDGPRAPMLAPRPGNLVSAATSAKTDEELLAILAVGVPRTAMRGWRDQLSNDERRNVLAYVRSLVHFQESPSTPLPPP
ncbi:MAG: cytochrome c [Nitrospirota bacterium]|nr:cytochrome c [Nitrospirota bacterium]MDH4359203.1 cytochrome c [Nitrospirota bacterium]MDH5296512.1 cytochrome c [Nitrospirota bacterium]